MRYLGITPGEFPHSDICGLTAVCAFPQLFAACHVLRRLLVPRHSPYALIRLTKRLLAKTLYSYAAPALLFGYVCLYTRPPTRLVHLRSPKFYLSNNSSASDSRHFFYFVNYSTQFFFLVSRFT